MGRKSTIDRLPAKLRRALNVLLQHPQTTVDQATVYVNGLINRSDRVNEPCKRVSNVKNIAESIKHLGVAASQSVDRERNIRKVIAEETIEKLKNSGLEKGTVGRVAMDLYGVEV